LENSKYCEKEKKEKEEEEKEGEKWEYPRKTLLFN